MTLWHSLAASIRQFMKSRPRGASRPVVQGGKRGRFLPAIEFLEGRLCPSGGYLLVSSYNTDSIMRYDAATGAFVDQFVSEKSGNLRNPLGIVFGPDHNLYVSSGHFTGQAFKYVNRYDGTTGAFIDHFVDNHQLGNPRAVLFGPDGNLYVADRGHNQETLRVVRFNGTTGAYIDDFVPPGSVEHVFGMVFGPNGKKDGKLDLYISDSSSNNNILRYDGTTGAFKGVFAHLDGIQRGLQGLVFGPDGNLYVGAFGDSGSVSRFAGPGAKIPGAFLGAFVPGGSGGLSSSTGLLFGPDGNGDGKLDLYVANAVRPQVTVAELGTSEVLRYDGVTGAFIDTFVTPDSGGLRFPSFMTFTETDPTTLNYLGSSQKPDASATPAALVQPTSTSPSGVLTTLIPGPLVLLSNTIGNFVNLDRSANPPAAGDLLTISPSTGYKIPGASHAAAALDRFFAEHAETLTADLFSADILSALLRLEKTQK